MQDLAVCRSPRRPGRARRLHHCQYSRSIDLRDPRRLGRTSCFYNVCMHRGHILVEGTGNKRIITCPFHAWSYDSHGNLKAAGNAENVAGFKLEDFHLSEVQVEAFGPMVYFNLDPATPSLASQAGGLLERFRGVIPSFDELHFAQRTSFPVAANWKFILDGMVNPTRKSSGRNTALSAIAISSRTKRTSCPMTLATQRSSMSTFGISGPTWCSPPSRDRRIS